MESFHIEFNKLGYDPLLDFFKAYAIVGVLISHTCYTLPYFNKLCPFFWVEMQVPIFVLIQAFHVLKKPSSELNLKKLFIRIVLPFIIVQFGIIFISLIHKNTNIIQVVKIFIYGGGYGPGSYYPWIYIQLAIILYFVKPLFEKGNLINQLIVWIGICEGLEILESCINIPDFFHRLLAVRYLFLIVLAWYWVKKGITINRVTLLLSILSMMSIAYFAYYSFNNEPFFYNTVWSYHRWPCYFYVSTLLCYLLNILYKKISKVSIINKVIKFLAKCSYEIFLTQMAVIAILPNLNYIKNEYFALILWILLVWTVSLAGGYIFNKFYSNFLKRII